MVVLVCVFRLHVGVAEFGVFAVAEEASLGREVGDDIRGGSQAGVDLPGFRGEVTRAHGLGGADLGRLDGGVVAVRHVDVLGMAATGNASGPRARDVRAG